MLKSSLCDYSDAFIHFKGTITITGDAGPEPNENNPRNATQSLAARQANKRNKCVIFKICAPFINCISEINNTQVDNAEDIDIVMPMYNLLEYSDNCLWQYHKDQPNDNLAGSESFESKIKITGNKPAYGNTKYGEIMMPLKYLSNF